MKKTNTTAIWLLICLLILIGAQISTADTNAHLRDELDRVSTTLKWTQNDLGVCRGDMR